MCDRRLAPEVFQVSEASEASEASEVVSGSVVRDRRLASEVVEALEAVRCTTPDVVATDHPGLLVTLAGDCAPMSARWRSATAMASACVSAPMSSA